MMFPFLLAAALEVTSFGAKGDGVTLDTAAIQHAIDTAAAQGGGEVVLTPGIYLTGTIYLKSHVTLRLERAASLRGSPDLKDYNAEDAYPQNWGSPSPENWRGHHLILALEQEDVAVVGEGIVDGNGRAFFSEFVHGVGKTTWRFGAMNAKDRKNAVRAGQMMVFVECRGVRVEGVRLYDAPCWNCFCHGCENVRIRDVTAIADIRHHNTDGFDIDCCRDVLVSGCEVETGDDCFTVRADVRRLKTPRVCEDVRFENCRGACSACGVRIGVGDGAIRNVAISNLVIRTAGVGICLQSNYSGKKRRGVDISDVRVEDFVIRDASQGLTLTYGVGAPSTVLRDVCFSRGTVEATHPVTVLGNGTVTPDGISFTDVALRVKPDRSAVPRKEPVLVEKAGRVTFDHVTLDGKKFGETASASPNAWENTAVNSSGRLPPRTFAPPLADMDSALSDELEPPTPYVLSLNGQWKISWCGEPGQRPVDFHKVGFDDSDWETVDVPSCLETRGFGVPGYTNGRYPHKLAWPKILDVQSGRPDYNPVASYRRPFTVPETWKSRDVILRFDGVYSAYTVWVNGRKVGYAEDSKLPSEFDITPYLNSPGDGNLLAVEVYRWCDGSYLEDQDMFRFTGIFRDVTLWAKPKDGIWDFAVRTTPVDGYERWRLEVEVDGGATALSLYDADKKKAGDLTPLSTSTYSLDLSPCLWSAEDPYLYTLVIRKGEDIRRRRIGFKDVRIDGNTVKVNGRAVKFHGVNRHEHSLANGRTVSLEEMIADIVLMKRHNIDTVRTSHYPDHRLWYDLCDKYGIYLCAEANVEGHGAGYKEGALGMFPDWEQAIVERNVRHVLFYRNHPSVTLWSVGNETGHGPCFTKAIAAVRALDPRPIHWERANAEADVDSIMYPSVDWLDARGRLGDGLTNAVPLRNPWDDTTHAKGKAFFLCEYAHAMGNALGNFKEYWDVMYRYDSLSGGCIWDWVDQTLVKRTDRLGEDGGRESFLAYGGDWDEQPNDGPYCCNGLIRPDRQVTAKLVEVAHVHRPLAVSLRADGTLEIWNHQSFTSAAAFAGEWELLEDGAVVRRGEFEVPPVAPGQRGTLSVDLGAIDAAKPCERFLTVRFKLRQETIWAPRGWVVASDQVALGGVWKPAAPEPSTMRPSVVETTDDVTVTAGPTKAVFARKTGTLRLLEMNGRQILADRDGRVSGPRLEVNRAFVDNDKWLRGKNPSQPGAYRAFGLTQLTYHPRPLAVTTDGKTVRVVSRVRVNGRKSGGFDHETISTFFGDGRVRMDESVEPFGTMPPALPRLGTSWFLDEGLESVEWYGRGPFENYVDRKSGSFLGRYRSTVTALCEPYVKPQDNGCRSDVRWFCLMDEQGRGVRFEFPEPMFVHALHYSLSDLAGARHGRHEPGHCSIRPPRKEVCLNLDFRQLGLGGGSCGPEPLDEHVFPIQAEKWSVLLTPVVGRR